MRRRRFLGLGLLALLGISRAKLPSAPVIPAAEAVPMAWVPSSEGTFLFLDGGKLELGIVKDSLLNATNTYEVFAENFESAIDDGEWHHIAVTSTASPT